MIGTGLTLSLETLEQSIRDARRLLEQPEPFEVWMTAQGFPPAKGGMLALPESMRATLDPEAAMIWPMYVRFSAVIEAPMLMWNLIPLAPGDFCL